MRRGELGLPAAEFTEHGALSDHPVFIPLLDRIKPCGVELGFLKSGTASQVGGAAAEARPPWVWEAETGQSLGPT